MSDVRDRSLSATAIHDLTRIGKDYAHDPEAAHVKAEEVICDLLYGLGFVAVVEEWRHLKRQL
jgi:hypothetical protein